MRELPASVPRDKVKEPARVSPTGEVLHVVVTVEMLNVDMSIKEKQSGETSECQQCLGAHVSTPTLACRC